MKNALTLTAGPRDVSWYGIGVPERRAGPSKRTGSRPLCEDHPMANRALGYPAGYGDAIVVGLGVVSEPPEPSRARFVWGVRLGANRPAVRNPKPQLHATPGHSNRGPEYRG